jgi:hypothetical protein
MNVHSTIDLHRHTGGERQIARRQSGNRPPHILGVSQRLMGVKPFTSSLLKRSWSTPVMGVLIKPGRISYIAIPCQSDDDAATDPAHATRYSRDFAR